MMKKFFFGFAIIAFPFIASTLVAQNIKGKLISIDTFISQFVSNRKIDIWLPSNYSENKKYAVIYMHDGVMLFDSSKTWNHQEWEVDETSDYLILNQFVQDYIVVAIHCSPNQRYMNYVPEKPFYKFSQKDRQYLLQKNQGKPHADNYLKFITSELKPYIDKHFATQPSSSHTFIAGSSMGGLISLYAICEYPKIFGGTLCFSTHFPIFIGKDYQKNDMFQTFYNYLKRKLPLDNYHQFYFDFGTQTLDSLYQPYQSKINTLFTNYSKNQWLCLKDSIAAHNEIAWKKRFPLAISFVLSKNKRRILLIQDAKRLNCTLFP